MILLLTGFLGVGVLFTLILLSWAAHFLFGLPEPTPNYIQGVVLAVLGLWLPTTGALVVWIEWMDRPR
jgi:hypothetical protein